MNEARYRATEDRLWASLGVAPVERRLQLAHSGASIRVQELGEGPPVVFVHGGSISGTSWAPLAVRLPGFRCILVDRPGCGLSAPLATRFDDVRQLGAFADTFVVDVLDALQVERAHLAATSFGGYTALHAVAAHPGRVDRFIQFGWPIGAPITHTPLVMRVAAVPLVARLGTVMPPSAFAVRAILRGIGLGAALKAGRISQEGLDWFLSLLRDTDTMRNELRAGPRLLSPIGGFNESLRLPPEFLARIKTPTYFLWGEEDPFGGADVARQFVGQIEGAELELMPGAGHAVWMDDAERAAVVTRRFLGGAITT